MGILRNSIGSVWPIFRDYTSKFFSKDYMWTPFVRLIPYILRSKRSYAGLVGAMLGNVVVSLSVARFLQLFTDAAVHQDLHKIGRMLPLGIGIIVLGCIAAFFETYFRDIVVNQVETAVQNDLFKKALTMKTERIDDYNSGDIITRLTYDIRRVGAAAGMHILHVARLVFMAVGALAYLLMINWRLTLFSVVMVPPAVIIMMVISKSVRSNSGKISEAIAQLQSLLHETFGGLTVIRTFTLEEGFIQRFLQGTGKVFSLQVQNSKLRGTVNVGGNLVHFASFLLSFTIGAYYLAHREISVGQLLAFMTLMQNVVGPMLAAPRELGGYQAAMSCTIRIWELMDEETEMDAHWFSNRRVSIPSLDIQFTDVTFSYPKGLPVIKQVSLSIPAGRVVALVGPSGAGKSTMFKLLLGLYKLSEGQISINGVSTDQIHPHKLRRMIAYVPQETFLFTGTIRENIRYGLPEATDDQIVQAAKDANAHDFIMSLPHGYNTEVGERGMRLSGGQRQRVAIARAILKDAPILLLDEATSALDAESEQQVQEALQKLMYGRTTLVIAHRMSTVLNADYVYVLDKGRLIEQGTHQELLDNKPLYTKLYRLQFRAHEPRKTAQF